MRGMDSRLIVGTCAPQEFPSSPSISPHCFRCSPVAVLLAAFSTSPRFHQTPPLRYLTHPSQTANAATLSLFPFFKPQICVNPLDINEECTASHARLADGTFYERDARSSRTDGAPRNCLGFIASRLAVDLGARWQRFAHFFASRWRFVAHILSTCRRPM